MTGEQFFRKDENVSAPFRYTGCGLDDVYLLNGYEVMVHDGEEYVAVRDIDDLHVAIGRHLVTTRKTLSAREVKFLRVTLNMTQEQLGKALRKDAQSIARWEKGQVQIPSDAESLLRIVFFAETSNADELRALRELIVEKIRTLEEQKGSQTRAQFRLEGHWSEYDAAA
ncbi:MAG: helix-turn-helix domain-containing protein [Hyphomicrobiales bacterium]